MSREQTRSKRRILKERLLDSMSSFTLAQVGFGRSSGGFLS